MLSRVASQLKIAITRSILEIEGSSIQFLLDLTTIPKVMRASQIHGDYMINDILYLGRTWCFSLHRERLKRLWEGFKKKKIQPGAFGST